MNQLFPSLLLLLVVLWPLLLAGTLLLRNLHPLHWHIVAWAAMPAFLLALFAPSTASLPLPWLMLSSKLGFGGETGRLFFLFITLLWWLSGIYARAYITHEAGRRRFFCYFLLSMCGNMGVVLALDLMSFYLFFALMSFASYGLVAHERSKEALHAGRVYIILVVIGEVALFSAMLLTAISTGSTEFDFIRQEFAGIDRYGLIISLASIGFGIKAGVLGLQMWLPLAHPVAPTPASAVLSGAMIKAGLLGWLRLLPLGGVVMLQWGEIFILFGLIAAFYGVLVGLMQSAPKTVLAYSSISQMGLMTMALGLCMTTPAVYPEVLTIITLFALHHGLCKGSLFLGVGVVSGFRGSRQRWSWLALWMPALALAGAPLTSGMAVKALLKAQAVNAVGHWETILPLLLPWSSVATTLLVGKFLLLLHKTQSTTPSHSATPGMVWSWAALVLASVVMPWFFLPESEKLWSQAALTGSLWPVLLGIAVLSGSIGWKIYHVRSPGQQASSEAQKSGQVLWPGIPPGDILVPVSRVLDIVFGAALVLFTRWLPRWRQTLLESLVNFWDKLQMYHFLGRMETTLRYWPVPMVAMVVLGLVMAMLGVMG